MNKYNDFINNFLIQLEFETANNIELNNQNFDAEEELKYKKPIILN